MIFAVEMKRGTRRWSAEWAFVLWEDASRKCCELTANVAENEPGQRVSYRVRSYVSAAKQTTAEQEKRT